MTVRLLSDDAAPVDFPYTVAGNSRLTIPVNNLPRFRSANFATVVTASQPVFVERAMYWLGFEGGHDATAVSSLSTVWRFAEGFTGGDFETYFLLANTTGASISATLSFFTDSGAVVTKTVPIAPNSRRTVRVRDYPELVDAAFATTITASAPIVAERAMYWGGFVEGHATAGLTDESTRWAFAEGLAGIFGGQPYETFYLFLNASASPITVTGSFYREDGYGTRQQYTIPANSRFTLYGAAVPHMNGQKFGAVFEGSAPFIVERAVYWGAGRFGGHVSTGTPYTGTRGHAGRAARAAPASAAASPAASARRSCATTCRARRSARSSAAASTASATSSPTSAPASSTPCRRSPRAISNTS